MAAKTTKTKTVTAHEQAITETAERVTELETLVAALRAELETLVAEQAELQHLHDHGYDLDLDRFGELTDSLIPRREARLETLTTETLPEAKRAAERAVLLELAERDADGIPGKYAAYLQAVADAEDKVAQALTDARAAAEEWSTFIGDVSFRAQDAGLSDTRHYHGDTVEHPISYSSTVSLSARPKRAVLPVKFAGETYRTVKADEAVRGIASGADDHLRGLIKAAVDADIVSEGQRIQALTSGR